MIAGELKPLMASGGIDRVLAERLDRVLASLPRFDTPSTGTLVHGDFHGNQILVDDAGLVAVIDWGDVHSGDPALDLAAVHAILPESVHDDFFSEYGDVDPLRWEAARSSSRSGDWRTASTSETGPLRWSASTHFVALAGDGTKQVLLELNSHLNVLSKN